MNAPTYIRIDDDGQEVERFTAAHRTRLFREKYPLHDWAIRTRIQPSGMTLPDNGNNQVPCVEIECCLVRNGTVVEQVHKLHPILVQGSYEAGETFARCRLFDVIGIPAGPEPDATADAIEAEELSAHQAHEGRVQHIKPKIIESGEAEKVREHHRGPDSGTGDKTADTPGERKPKKVSKALDNQIKARCKALGIEVPEYSTPGQAKKVWKELAQKAKEAS
jgi:hypothetical protein